MKLYTKRGDDGTTGLVGGSRVSKGDVRVAAYGEVDECNAAVGAVLAACRDEGITTVLQRIQSELFTLGSELATPEGQTPVVAVGDEHVAHLEACIDEAEGEVTPLKNFVLPGGSEVASRLHLARAVCRRAERAAVTLSQQQSVRSHSLVYLNRLSDLLFVLARLGNHREGVVETPWMRPRSSS